MTDVKAEALMEHTTIYLLSPENISLIKQGELYKNNGGNIKWF